MRKRLKGRLTISKPTTNQDGPDVVRIRLIDQSSYCELIEVEMEKSAFADALFSLGNVPCDYELATDCPVGKKREVKDQLVFIPEHHHKDGPKTARAAIAPLETDGWRGRDDDAQNHHNRTQVKEPPKGKKGSWYHVTFIRFVDPD